MPRQQGAVVVPAPQWLPGGPVAPQWWGPAPDFAPLPRQRLGHSKRNGRQERGDGARWRGQQMNKSSRQGKGRQAYVHGGGEAFFHGGVEAQFPDFDGAILDPCFFCPFTGELLVGDPAHFGGLEAMPHGNLEAALGQAPLGALPDGSSASLEKAWAEAAEATELLLDLLAPETTRRCSSSAEREAVALRPTWPQMEARSANSEESAGFFPASFFVGKWIDSDGSMVDVCATDAFDVHLMATLSRRERHDVTLPIRPVAFGGGWICGHSVLEPTYSTPSQLHWVAADGRLTVWVIWEDTVEQEKSEGELKPGVFEEAETQDGATGTETHSCNGSRERSDSMCSTSSPLPPCT